MITYEENAIDYIAKISSGGMRDAITLMDKCLSYSTDLTLDNVIKSLGVADYETMFRLNDAIMDCKSDKVIEIIENIHMSGKDLKQFVQTYMKFLLDICKYDILRNFDYLEMPSLYESEINQYGDYEFGRCKDLLDVIIKLQYNIKYETNPKVIIESVLMMECKDE